jgi:hypothetical protein
MLDPVRRMADSALDGASAASRPARRFSPEKVVAVEGFIVRGRLVKLELPDSPDGFANVTVESRRDSGEPKWWKLAYPMAQQGTTVPTSIAAALNVIPMDSFVELGCEAKVSARGFLWYRAFAAEVVEPVGQSANGSKARPARAGATA